MPGFDDDHYWRPSISLATLQLRAEVLRRVRQFFADRQILEVETPLLSQATATDKHLHSFHTDYCFSNPTQKKTYYLQTSPEFAMKRLLASGSGAIYQLCKAFRNQGELGQRHNPEFTLLEWYRPGLDHHALMNEVEDLLRVILKISAAERLSYAALFQKILHIDPHESSAQQLQQIAQLSQPNLASLSAQDMDRDQWLSLLMTHCIEPQLPKHAVFIYDFPASQAALARIRPGDPPLAERFEVYVQGIELANGFHELTSSTEQRQRFRDDLSDRKKDGLSAVPMDERLLAALTHGMPDCAGVALGIDRLMLLLAQKDTLNEVLAFPFDRA